jgi:poly(beta-D-mannuronate) lyase
MTMRKSLFATAILLGLTACGGNGDEPAAPTPTPTPAPAPTPTNTPAQFSGDVTANVTADVSSVQGNVTVTDPDAGEAAVVSQTDIAGTNGTFSIDSSGLWSYSVDAQNVALIALAEGSTVTESVNISSVDGATTSITVTVTGVNDAPVIGTGEGVNAGVMDNQQTDSIGGVLTITDPDTDQASFMEQSDRMAVYGVFSIATNGAWTYTLDTANATVQSLVDQDDSVIDSISVTSADGTNATVDITISGVQVMTTSFLSKGSIGSNDQVPDVDCTTVVTSTSALEDAAGFDMTPGETLCLVAGNYSGLDLTFGGVGTLEAPITIAAEEPGSVIIGGEVFVGMTGEYVVFHGFVFKDGSIDSSLLQTRANSNTPCNNCRITENTFVNMDQGIDDSTKWIQIYGENNRIDHNWISGKTTRGALFTIERGDEPGTVDRTQIDHNYFGDRPPKDGLAYADGSDNEYEGIRIGSSDTHTSDSFAVIEHNYFEGIDGEAEVISVKAGGVKVRHNTIRNSRGSIVSRHGEGTEISNNFILGDGNPFSGGIRVVDANHSITNNYIEGARYLSTNFNGGILVSNSNGSISNGYQDVENVLVANNTIVNSVNSINLYAGNQDDRPDSVYFVNNVVADAIGPVIRNVDKLPTNPVFSGNYVSGLTFSDDENVTSLAGFTIVNPELAYDSQGIARPTATSPSLVADLAASVGDFDLPSADMDGQIRTVNTLSGADENLDEVPEVTALRGLLAPELVGPISYTAPAQPATVVPFTIDNANFDSADLTAWTNNNASKVTDSSSTFSKNTSAQVIGTNSSISQIVAVTANTNYTLSAFVSGQGTLSAMVGGNTFSVDNNSSDYEFTSVSFNSGTETSVNIMGALDTSVVSGVTLNNANFDDDQTDWTVNEGSGIGQVQDSSNSSSSTDGSIKFKYNDDDSGTPYGPYIAQTITVTPNTEYTLTMYILLKSADEQDSTVLFGAHSGSAIEDGMFAASTILGSKNSIYANLSEAEEAEDSFRPDSVTFNSGANTTVTIFAQYQSTLGDDIRIDEFSVTSSGGPATDAKAAFDDFRLVSHPSLNN